MLPLYQRVVIFKKWSIIIKYYEIKYYY